jgi:hypothetical protein
MGNVYYTVSQRKDLEEQAACTATSVVVATRNDNKAKDVRELCNASSRFLRWHTVSTVMRKDKNNEHGHCKSATHSKALPETGSCIVSSSVLARL